ncbi:MAG: TolC family protein, partial [Xanthomonadales bacterium]|nr:TolC family protein [Xanthomonadales bacterium]
MAEVMTYGRRLRFALSLATLLCALPLGAGTAKPITIGLIGDGVPIGQLAELEQTFLEEIEALTRGEFELRIKRFYGDWSAASIRDAYEAAVADTEVDLILGLGIATDQLLVGREAFPKPTFLPLVLDGQLLNAPIAGDRSGKRNLNYLTDRMDFDEHLRALQRVVPFQSVALVVDAIVFEAAPELAAEARRLAAGLGVDLSFALHHGDGDDPLDQLESGLDAAIVSALPRMPPEEFDRMLERLVDRGLPAFGLTGGRASVARGLLASDAVAADMTRLARRNALNVQAFLLGERTQDQPVLFEGKRELTINMEVARRIGVSPRFDVLSEAVLLNEEPVPQGPVYALDSAARLAVTENLDLLAEQRGVEAGNQSVSIARANLLPRLSLNASHRRRDVSPLVEAGQVAERSADAALSLSQPIYVDDLWANRQIQEQVQLSREQAYEQLRLDIIQSTTVSFLNVLRAQTQLRILQDNLNLTRTNLELARDRVRVGSSSPADIYRWESRLANARSDVLAGRSTLDRAREALNRILNRPLREQFQLVAPTVETPLVFTEAEFNRLVDNPRTWGFFIDFMVENGLESSPELAQLDALIDAKTREVTNLRRDFWLPDVTLSGQYSDNLSQSGVGSGPPFENEDDWILTLNASLPLFAGGARRAAVSRADLEL